MAEITGQDNEADTTENVYRTKMQEECILQRLKDRGYRITRQRRMLLDIILQEECASFKEIYYKARKTNRKIGVATVYRMINLLEEIGAIRRNSLYKLSYSLDRGKDSACIIELDDHTVCQLSAEEWNKVIVEGLRVCGYIEQQGIADILFISGKKP